MKRIGVISDTDGLLRPEALKQLEGSDLIIQAGDIGAESIISKLELIAPVIAVRGNVDNAAWCYRYPLSNAVELGEVSIYVYHGHLDLDIDLTAGGFQILISGHTHVPKVEEQNGILHLNPGSAGRKRFSLPVSMAELIIDGENASANLISLG